MPRVNAKEVASVNVSIKYDTRRNTTYGVSKVKELVLHMVRRGELPETNTIATLHLGYQEYCEFTT